MTTKITVDAHAGWPVAVYALDSFGNSVKESELGVVAPGNVGDFHATSSREIRVVELRKEGEYVGPRKPLDFAAVVRGLKAGKRFAREGWNGKGMFIFLVPGSRFTVNREPLLSILGAGTEVDYHGHVDMRTATGQIVPWLCSQTDLLAEDWVEV
ncbi:MAG: DUF2829 domain-containing protein [Methylacidiphilales bacterium]|nr:DUF2829 domain-containing protein [Candidatus Methylacidiphilales bacterium]